MFIITDEEYRLHIKDVAKYYPSSWDGYDFIIFEDPAGVCYYKSFNTYVEMTKYLAKIDAEVVLNNKEENKSKMVFSILNNMN